MKRQERFWLVQVVLEEAKSGYSQKRKDRFVGGIMTPAQPEYLHGQVDAKGDLAKDTSSATPILGVASSVGGYTVLPLLDNPPLYR